MYMQGKEKAGRQIESKARQGKARKKKRKGGRYVREGMERKGIEWEVEEKVKDGTEERGDVKVDRKRKFKGGDHGGDNKVEDRIMEGGLYTSLTQIANATYGLGTEAGYTAVCMF